MARIEGIDPATAEGPIAAVFRSQTDTWGSPLLPHRIQARLPKLYRGVGAMWSGVNAHGLLDPGLVAMVNRRVAGLNGCPF